MTLNQPPKSALYLKVLSTQYRPLLWFFAIALLVLGLLCARAAWLQPEPVLRLVLGWVAFFLLFPVLPLALVRQQSWLDTERQQLWLGKGVFNGSCLDYGVGAPMPFQILMLCNSICYKQPIGTSSTVTAKRKIR